MDLITKPQYPIVPLRIFGLGFLLAWLWTFLFFNPLLEVRASFVLCMMVGAAGALILLALAQRFFQGKVFAVATGSYFVFALLGSVVTITILGLHTIALIELSMPFEVALWTLLGFAFVVPLAEWLKLYTQWDIDNASFFTILSFLFSTVLCAILAAFVELVFIAAVSLLPLISFAFYKLCVKPFEGTGHTHGFSYKKLFAEYRMQVVALFAYSAVAGYVYTVSLLGPRLVQDWYSIAGIAIAGLITIAILWLHYSRRRGMKIMERAFAFCAIAALAISPFVSAEYLGAITLAFQVGTAFLLMLQFIFLIDIVGVCKTAFSRPFVVIFGSSLCGAFIGFAGSALLSTVLAVSQETNIVVSLVLILLLLAVTALLTVSSTDWVGSSQKALAQGGEVVSGHKSEPIGLDIISDVQVTLSETYTVTVKERLVTETTTETTTAAAATVVTSAAASATILKANWKSKCEDTALRYNLSPREVDVFMLLAKGRNANWIAQELFISLHTVRSHINHIYEKLEVHSGQELIDLVEGESMASAEVSPSSTELAEAPLMSTPTTGTHVSEQEEPALPARQED